MNNSTSMTTGTLRVVGALALLAQAAVHLQQWLIGLSGVAVVGPMFLANAVLAGATAIGVAVRGGRVSVLGGIAVSVGALIALAMAFTVGLFGFQTGGLTRVPIIVAILSEVIAVGALATYLSVRRV